MFLSTVGRSTISDDEKMTHLKILLTGPAKWALTGIGYSGVMYETAWKTLESKFGQPHLITGSQLTKTENHQQIRPYNIASFVIFVDTVGNFVNVLQQFGYSNDLLSSSNLDMKLIKYRQTKNADGLHTLKQRRIRRSCQIWFIWTNG